MKKFLGKVLEFLSRRTFIVKVYDGNYHYCKVFGNTKFMYKEPINEKKCI